MVRVKALIYKFEFGNNHLAWKPFDNFNILNILLKINFIDNNRSIFSMKIVMSQLTIVWQSPSCSLYLLLMYLWIFFFYRKVKGQFLNDKFFIRQLTIIFINNFKIEGCVTWVSRDDFHLWVLCRPHKVVQKPVDPPSE